MIAPTFDHGNDSVAFALGTMALWLAQVGDILVTRAGIWYHGEAEANNLFRKVLPLSAFKFLFNGAFGAFADASVRLVLCILLLEASKSIGYADNAHSYLPFGVAVIPAVVAIRNWLLIRKKPVTATIGQVS